ncbi:MAG: hypothetical protein H6729_17630 [Deltaproteobacteria bacterium]|nr:hypothetical protein [Deltaproteobacteria bacterium]
MSTESNIRETDNGFEVRIDLGGFEQCLLCASLVDAEALGRMGELTKAYVDLLRADAEDGARPKPEQIDDLIRGFESARAALVRVGYEIVVSMIDSKLTWLRQTRARVVSEGG